MYVKTKRTIHHYPCLNQFALLCPSYLFLPKPSLNLTATFLDASQLFSIILLAVEPVSLPHPYSPYCPYYRPCMCSEKQFPQQVGTLWFSFVFFWEMYWASEGVEFKPKTSLWNSWQLGSFNWSMCGHKSWRYLQSWGLSFICKCISLMSQTTATAFLLNRIKTSNRSF